MSAQPAFELPGASRRTSRRRRAGSPATTCGCWSRRGDGRLDHARSRDLPDFLRAGDLVVVNTSATLPAALRRAPRRRQGARAAPLDAAARRAATTAGSSSCARGGASPSRRRAGDGSTCRAARRATLLAPYPTGARLWLAALDLPEPLLAYLARHGEPIRYGYVPDALAALGVPDRLRDRARQRRDAERGPAVHARLLAALGPRGVGVAPIVLHTGVSSLERHEPPYPERFRVPAETARLVNADARLGRARDRGRHDRRARAGDRRRAPTARVARRRGLDGLVDHARRAACAPWTACSPAGTSPRRRTCEMLEAIAGRELARASYAAALQAGYLWHEFGDVHLILP